MNGKQIKNQPTFLCGWKEIAKYMGMSVRSVQRYEALFGLPVRRVAHKSRSGVIATKKELDAWVDARPLAHVFALHREVLDVASLKAFRMALAEQHQLREEMMKMREELHATVQALHETIGTWHDDFTATEPVEKYRKVH